MTSKEKKLLFEILNNLYSKGVEKELHVLDKFAQNSLE